MGIVEGGTTTTEDVVLTSVVFDEALVRVLVRKGLITEQEIIDEMEAVRTEMAHKQRTLMTEQ